MSRFLSSRRGGLSLSIKHEVCAGGKEVDDEVRGGGISEVEVAVEEWLQPT